GMLQHLCATCADDFLTQPCFQLDGALRLGRVGFCPQIPFGAEQPKLEFRELRCGATTGRSTFPMELTVSSLAAGDLIVQLRGLSCRVLLDRGRTLLERV